MSTADQISREDIANQITKICETESFKRSEKLTAFLKYIVDEAHQQKGNSIKAWTIAVEVFNRPHHFDAQTDSIVRVYGSKLRRALNNYYNNEGQDDDIVIKIPKGSYQPEIIHKKAANTLLANQQNISAKPPTNIWTDNPTVAVMMFDCTARKKKYNYIACGLTLECIMSLSQFPALTVLGPITSRENLFNPITESEQIDDSTFVLQGWISMEGEILHIQISLSQGMSHKHIWGKSFIFSLKSDSLLSVKEEVTSTIAGAIGGEIGIVFHQIQSESYKDYIKFNDVTHAVLKFNTYWFTHHPDDFRQANLTISKGLAKQPKNALLHALLGNQMYADVVHQSNWLPDSKDNMESQIRYAIALDPNLQIARYNMVVLNSFLGDANECSKEANQVYDMNPNNSMILGGCSAALATVGCYDQAKEYVERAKRLNPQYPSWYHLIDYIIAYKDEQYDLALELSKKIHVNGLLWHPIFRASILGMVGKQKEAEPYLKELLQLKPDFLSQPLESIRRLFILDKHVEMIWDGLKKAGIEAVGSNGENSTIK